MNELLRIGESFFAWVLATSWQAGVLALLVVLAQTVFRRRLSPGWRYGLWLLVIVRLLLPEAPPAAWSIFNIARLPATTSAAEKPPGMGLPPPHAFLPLPAPQNNPNPAQASPAGRLSGQTIMFSSVTNASQARQTGLLISWQRAAFVIWLLGTAFFAARLAWANLRFSRDVEHEPRVTNEPVLHLLEACREKMGVFQSVTLVESRAVQSPSVHGLWRKRLLLPQGTTQNFSTDELRCIFLHELAHLKRRDLEVNWLASLLLVVHWFNPLLGLAFARMGNDRELACDALALTHLGGGLAEPYGETIIKVVGNLLHPPRPPGVLALSENRERLKERIRMIAGFRQWPRWSVLAMFLAFGIAAVGLTNASRARTNAGPLPQRTASVKPAAQGDTNEVGDIRIKVVDFTGNPVTSATVQGQGFSRRLTTDTEGRCVWTPANGPRSFEITKIGFKRLFTGSVTSGGGEAVFRLQHALLVAGRVIDKETRQPIKTFQVHHVRLLQGPVTPSPYPFEVLEGSLGEFKFSPGEFKYSFGDCLSLDSALCVDAEGYQPLVSRMLTAGDDGKELLFAMIKSQPVAGTLWKPDGTPANRAEVRLWCGEPNMSDIPRRHETESDQSGAFSVPEVLDGRLLVYDTAGWAEVSWNDFRAVHRVQLTQWSHLKGHWPKPLPKSRRVSIKRMNWAGGMNSYTRPVPWSIADAQVNADGSFQFDEGLPSGEYMLAERNDLLLKWTDEASSMMLLPGKRGTVSLQPGQAASVEIPSGRSVVGKVDSGYEQTQTNANHLPVVSLHSMPKGPELEFPKIDGSLSESENLDHWKQHRQRSLEYWLSEKGMARRRAERLFQIPAESDGTFRIDNVPPGIYELSVDAWLFGGKAGSGIERQVTIQPPTDDSPVDLGIVK